MTKFQDVRSPNDLVRATLNLGERAYEPEPPYCITWAGQLDKNASVPLHLYLVIIGVICCLCTLALLAAHTYYLEKYISSENLQRYLYCIIFLPPMTTVAACFGMMMPRVTGFIYAVVLSYYMLCLYISCKLMYSLIGGRQALLDSLEEEGKVINFTVVRPFCLFKCLPTFQPTMKRLRIVEFCILQTAFVRIAVEIIDQLVFLEIRNRTNFWFTFSNAVAAGSSFLAFFATYIMVDLSRRSTTNYRFPALFRLVDLSQSGFTTQKTLFHYLNVMQLIPALTSVPDENGNFEIVLGPSANTMFYFMFALTVELLLISIVASIILRPSINHMFDLYGHRDEQEPVTEHVDDEGGAVRKRKKRRRKDGGKKGRKRENDDSTWKLKKKRKSRMEQISSSG